MPTSEEHGREIHRLDQVGQEDGKNIRSKKRARKRIKGGKKMQKQNGTKELKSTVAQLTVPAIGEDGCEVERLDQVRPDELVECVVHLSDALLLDLQSGRTEHVIPTLQTAKDFTVIRTWSRSGKDGRGNLRKSTN